jgi:peptidoglycan/LPS O-acetylase OafA/YrhL
MIVESPPTRAAPGRRYKTLDAWRAIAALAVVVFHCTSTVVTPEMGWWARALLYGWAGVFIFFPISGYCILAALWRDDQATLGDFLKRRWRRIAPPYWASILVAVMVGLAAAPFNHHALAYLDLGLSTWIAVLTLTQVWVHSADVVNSVYWTLCYEEQFYLVVGLTLLAPARYRLHLLVAVTVFSALYHFAQWPASLRIEGLFLKYWLEFACGIAAFVWLRLPELRVWAIVMFGLIAVSAIVSGSLGLTTSAAASVAFIVLARFDDAIASTRVGTALISIGLFSYSLYLVHVPIGTRVVGGLRRLPLPLLVPSMIAVVVSLVAGWWFYTLIERRFLNVTPTLPAARAA